MKKIKSVINTKTTILGATPGAILGIDGHPHERFSFAPSFSGRFFLGNCPRTRKNYSYMIQAFWKLSCNDFERNDIQKVTGTKLLDNLLATPFGTTLKNALS